MFSARIYAIRADAAQLQPGEPSSVSGAGEGFEARMGRAVAVQLPSPLRFPALRGRSGPARLGLTWSGRGGWGWRGGQQFGPASPSSPPPPRSSAAARPRRRRLPRTAAASKMPGQRRGGCRSPLVRGGDTEIAWGALRGKKGGQPRPGFFRGSWRVYGAPPSGYRAGGSVLPCRPFYPGTVPLPF